MEGGQERGERERHPGDGGRLEQAEAKEKVMETNAEEKRGVRRRRKRPPGPSSQSYWGLGCMKERRSERRAQAEPFVSSQSSGAARCGAVRMFVCARCLARAL
ncbi:hypothetical protein PoB_003131100 [Plakobranchus ocellatus]|uniref:Uncharacterized protein n=1 Tax=Plakobranchus ocellatus TaxID=259542 RepID=A0AAV4A948_9GAST|nr:hypothetical protein PoB_003131100 [Plakobranchus ocellatus]